MTNRLSVIILNWKSSESTINAINTIGKFPSIPINLIVVDNASMDDSINKIISGIENNLFCEQQVLSEDDIKKHTQPQNIRTPSKAIYYIQSFSNRGYAGGNNIGLFFAKNCLNTKYALLLNPDAVTDEKSLLSLISNLESDDRVAFSSGVLVYATKPMLIQCIGGGIYYSWAGRAKLHGNNITTDQIDNYIKTSRAPNYLMGACLLVRLAVLDDIGYIDERYFLYCEEMDWQWRAKKAGWKLSVNTDSIAVHGDSESTKGSERSHIFNYYHTRSSILFNTKWYGRLYSIAVSPIIIAIAISKSRGLKNAYFAFLGAIDGIFNNSGIKANL